MLGYCVAEASKATNSPQENRSLNPLEFQIERFMVHACLYLACGDNDEGVQVFFQNLFT